MQFFFLYKWILYYSEVCDVHEDLIPQLQLTYSKTI